MKKQYFFLLLLFSICMIFDSCVFINKRANLVYQNEIPEVVTYPVKVSLNDGSMVLFPKGYVILENNLTGSGLRYDFWRSSPIMVASISKESVSCFVVYEDKVQWGSTLTAFSPPLYGILFLSGILSEAAANPCSFSAPDMSCVPPTMYYTGAMKLRQEALTKFYARRNLSKIFNNDTLSNSTKKLSNQIDYSNWGMK